MSDKISEYFAYRYFIIETQQQSLLHQLSDKKKLFHEIFYSLKKSKKCDIQNRGKNYLLYHYKDLTDSLLVAKFSKCKKLTHFEARAEDIVKTKEDDYPFIYIIIDLQGQALLIQKNTSLFFSPNSARRVLEDYLTEIMLRNHFTVKISEVTYSAKFWDTVDEADKIYSLKLNLKSPNLFGGQVKANELLQQQREMFNNTEMNLEYKNELGELKVLKDNVADFIQYIAAGGGHYALSFIKKGITQTIKSIVNIKKFHLHEPEEKAFNDLLEAIKEVNRIEDTNDNKSEN